MIVCDGWIFRSDEVESIGSIVDEGSVCWFAIRTVAGSEYVICRQSMVEIFAQQATLLAELHQRDCEREARR
ncbi:hypothetical protein CCR98_19980 [Stenotrophomonas sp. WZN-1]|jgi:hypothetical protein|uniref:hypothetical protein n=1 Tax=Stenotrophomonas TaxID=40323 RepID=UPI000B445BDD|nr:MULTISPECIES: hypothetical protein [Stenotrophomonas]ARZ76345.1 hypothetical protein CCR98_19980 [Stenotrophomonas sp. WZN-1]MCU1110799.1 hypothetical protein [Stenotrophomonas maltophilia]